MQDEVTATEAKINFGELLSEVAHGKRHIRIKKQKKTVAVMVPLDDYEKYLLKKLQEKQPTVEEVLRRIDRRRRKMPLPPPGSPDAVQIIRELRGHED